jgi:hypothetical protein
LSIIENVNLISKINVDPILKLLSEEQKMLNSFISSVKDRTQKNNKKVPLT